MKNTRTREGIDDEGTVEYYKEIDSKNIKEMSTYDSDGNIKTKNINTKKSA